jgi:hypothetical protein
LAPRRLYYYGGSEGGREGIAMAQRFPMDFDGIVSAVPAINFTGLSIAGGGALMGQGWLAPAKVKMLHKAVLDACDASDGLNDGIASGTLATGGGLVFLGLFDGTVAAFDDATLDELWKINVGSPFAAPPMTFEFDGKQYVAIALGRSPLAGAGRTTSPSPKNSGTRPCCSCSGYKGSAFPVSHCGSAVLSPMEALIACTGAHIEGRSHASGSPGPQATGDEVIQ